MDDTTNNNVFLDTKTFIKHFNDFLEIFYCLLPEHN